MKRTYSRAMAWALALMALAVSGCVQRAPMLESQMGNSVTLLRAQQIMNPQAARNTDPVSGINGKEAQSAYGQYQKSFRTPEPQSGAFTIGIGTGR